MSADLRDLIAKATQDIGAAEQEVFALCKGPNRPGGRSFRMTVPVDPKDSDVVLIAGLDAGQTAVNALPALLDVVDAARGSGWNEADGRCWCAESREITKAPEHEPRCARLRDGDAS